MGGAPEVEDIRSNNNFIFENKSDAASAIYQSYPMLKQPKEEVIVLDDDESIIDLNIIRRFRGTNNSYKIE